MTHLRVTQAGLVALATTIIGQIIAFVPALAPDEQTLISLASTVIAAAFLGANALHHVADAHISVKDVETGAINAARSEIGKVDFTKLAQDAVSAQSIPDLEGKIRQAAQSEIQKLLGQLAQAPPATPLPVVSPEGVQAAASSSVV